MAARYVRRRGSIQQLQARFRLWRGGHELKYFDDHAVEILRFYSNALRSC